MPLACLAVSGLKADTIYSVEFSCSGNLANCGSIPAHYSGVEAQAATADSQFQNSNVWNYLAVPSSGTTNPSYSALVDSTGAATLAGFSLGGSVSWDPTSNFPNGSGGFGLSGNTFTVNGLTPSVPYTLFLYAKGALFTVGSKKADPSNGTSVITGTTSGLSQ